MDIFSRIIAAPRIDLTIGIVATLCAATIGLPIGVATGYWRGWASSTIARTMDVVQCLPTFILALSLVAFAGQSATNVIIVLAVLNAPIFARLVRAETYATTQRLFVEAAVATGNSMWRIIFRHLLPNCMRPVLVQIPVNVGWAVLMASGLSFLGAGIRPPTPEWGSMIAIGAPLLITGQWWVGLFPGIALGLCGLGLGLVGSALEVLLDPTRR
jgi:peptide/nickel transport system permease protein